MLPITTHCSKNIGSIAVHHMFLWNQSQAQSTTDLLEAYLTRNASAHMGKSSTVRGGQGKKTMASSTWLIKLEITSGGKF